MFLYRTAIPKLKTDSFLLALLLVATLLLVYINHGYLDYRSTHHIAVSVSITWGNSGLSEDSLAKAYFLRVEQLMLEIRYTLTWNSRILFCIVKSVVMTVNGSNDVLMNYSEHVLQ